MQWNRWNWRHLIQVSSGQIYSAREEDLSPYSLTIYSRSRQTVVLPVICKSYLLLVIVFQWKVYFLEACYMYFYYYFINSLRLFDSLLWPSK